jgi:hypothetical protein
VEVEGFLSLDYRENPFLNSVRVASLQILDQVVDLLGFSTQDVALGGCNLGGIEDGLVEEKVSF